MMREGGEPEYPHSGQGEAPAERRAEREAHDRREGVAKVAADSVRAVRMAQPPRRDIGIEDREIRRVEHAIADAHQRDDGKQPADAGHDARDDDPAGGERQPREEHRARAKTIDREARQRTARRRSPHSRRRPACRGPHSSFRTRRAAAERAAAARAGRNATSGARSRRRRSPLRRGGTSGGERDPRRGRAQNLNYTGSGTGACSSSGRAGRKVAPVRTDIAPIRIASGRIPDGRQGHEIG